MVPAQVFEQWHNNLHQRMDPAEKNNPMIEKKKLKKGSIFSSSSGASMVQGEKRAPSAINATDGSLHTMSLQVSNKVDP